MIVWEFWPGTWMYSEHKEKARLDALRQLNLLDTSSSESFDRLTRMAGQIFSLPISAVSLTDHDRQWFKSRIGVELNEIPREKAPCSYIAETTQMLVVPDFREDCRFRDSFLAKAGIRFYAGAPLTTDKGFGIGSMCVLGTEPRAVSEAEQQSLRDLAAMVMTQIELQHAFGRIDPQSGMANRTQFIEDLQDLESSGPANERRLIVLLDLASAEQLSTSLRVMGSSYLEDMVSEGALATAALKVASETAYHVATTQFALISPPGIDEEAYLASLQKALRGARGAAATRFMTTPSIGVAPFSLGQTDPREALKMAHSAAQDARRSETGLSLYSSVRHATHQRRFTLLNAFGNALESNDQLRLVYHPRVDIASGLCHGAEALLRWTHPTLGPVGPAEFIPIIEQTSLARHTTAAVLNIALAQVAAWRRSGLRLQVSINISATNLLERDFADQVADGLARHGVTADSLELEVTESAMMDNPDLALETLQTLADGGIQLAIDDFGTGYSSLAYLQRLPAQVVKIDQSFMKGLLSDARKQSLVATMVSLSHNLGYRVVAEGVETEDVLQFLQEASCDEVQGYLFGRPMEATNFVDWLTSHNGQSDMASRSASRKSARQQVAAKMAK